MPTLNAGNKHSGYTLDEMGGSNNPLRYIPTFEPSTDDDTAALTCLPLAFHANLPVKLGSEEAGRTTVGSGRKLFESLVKQSHLSPFSKTLLESLLLSPEWSSTICFLEWKASATKSRRRLLFRLQASAPDISVTESSLLPTLRAEDSDKNQRTELGMMKQAARRGCGHDLATVLTLRPTLRANKRGVPDSHGNVSGWSGLKLTSAFCERYMGFPENWTAVPESTRSAMRLSRRKSSKSSEQSAP